MKKSKKLLSVLAAVLLMTVMTFTTVFAATESFPEVVAITLQTDQGVARAGQTQDTTGAGYFWGFNKDTSAGSVYIVPKVRKNTINYWHNLDGVLMEKNTGADFSRNHEFLGTPSVHWSVELNPKGANKYGCLAKARAGKRALTAAEKTWEGPKK